MIPMSVYRYKKSYIILMVRQCQGNCFQELVLLEVI